MSQMGMDCQMPMQMTGSGCIRDCCQQGLPQMAAQLTNGAKPKTAAIQILLMAPPMAPPAQLALATAPPGSIPAAPPRYILFRAFRI
jgi:hypothetical protein